MEAVIFTGLQGSGKSTFFKERFFATHVRINLDMLRTRRREGVLLAACIEMKQPFVVDNTNPTLEERAAYIAVARAAGFRVVGYYFRSVVGECLRRNNLRSDRAKLPAVALYGTAKKLQAPQLVEGYDAIYYVRIGEDDEFLVEEWTGAEPPLG